MAKKVRIIDLDKDSENADWIRRLRREKERKKKAKKK